MSDQQNCGNCQYWQGMSGQCVRFPPLLVAVIGGGGCLFPIVQQYHWCGEWLVRTNRELSAKDKQTLGQGK